MLILTRDNENNCFIKVKEKLIIIYTEPSQNCVMPQFYLSA